MLKQPAVEATHTPVLELGPLRKERQIRIAKSYEPLKEN
jgi:hypothetical protein